MNVQERLLKAPLMTCSFLSLKALMNSIPLMAATLLTLSSVANALTISGQVTYGGQPLAGVSVTAPRAACTSSDAGGNFSCTVPAAWDGTLAPYLSGYTFSPAAITYSGLAANRAGQNFAATPALGLRAELAVYRPGDSSFHLDYNFDRVSDGIATFGGAGDIGLTGDLDGNGVSDLVLYRNGMWFIDYNLTSTVSGVVGYGGAPGDIPLVGDINGDGRDDMIIFRHGAWYVNGIGAYYFGGEPGDIPLVGDVNGDGDLDLIIYRRGAWYVAFHPETSRGDAAYYLGGDPNDIPIVFDYDDDGATTSRFTATAPGMCAPSCNAVSPTSLPSPTAYRATDRSPGFLIGRTPSSCGRAGHAHRRARNRIPSDPFRLRGRMPRMAQSSASPQAITPRV